MDSHEGLDHADVWPDARADLICPRCQRIVGNVSGVSDERREAACAGIVSNHVAQETAREASERA